MPELYYEIIEDGYYIKDRNSDFNVHQYEPYIPHPNMSYEENAKLQMKELLEMFEMQSKCSNKYGIPDTLYNQIIEDYKNECKDTM